MKETVTPEEYQARITKAIIELEKAAGSVGVLFDYFNDLSLEYSDVLSESEKHHLGAFWRGLRSATMDAEFSVITEDLFTVEEVDGILDGGETK